MSDGASERSASERAAAGGLRGRGTQQDGLRGRGTRAIGLDLGSKRIGVAVSSGTVASPLTTLQRSKRRGHDHEQIAKLVRDEEAEVVVIGLPLSLDGSHGPAARAATNEAKQLGSVVQVPIEMHDERFTTVTAERGLLEAGLDAPRRRKVVDKVAAAVMLQSWLDHRRSDHRHGDVAP